MGFSGVAEPSPYISLSVVQMAGKEKDREQCICFQDGPGNNGPHFCPCFMVKPVTGLKTVQGRLGNVPSLWPRRDKWNRWAFSQSLPQPSIPSLMLPPAPRTAVLEIWPAQPCHHDLNRSSPWISIAFSQIELPLQFLTFVNSITILITEAQSLDSFLLSLSHTFLQLFLFFS